MIYSTPHTPHIEALARLKIADHGSVARAIMFVERQISAVSSTRDERAELRNVLCVLRSRVSE